jgi:DNA repair exonuclease SbcCD ATPase subunit
MNTQHRMTSIAELKEVIGKLWKSVDSFKVSSAQEDQRIKDQIGEWTQTNLELLKLLAAKTGETERLAQNYSRLTSSLNKFDQEWQVLHQQIEQLKAVLITSKHGIQTGISPSEMSALQLEISRLSEQVRQAVPSELRKALIATYPLTVPSPSQPTSNWGDWVLSGSSILLVITLMVSGVVGKQQLDHIQQRVEWTLIKLQRLER